MSIKPTVQNTTDASRGQPLVERVQARLQELTKLRAALPADRLTAHADLEVAIAGGEALLTGNLADVSEPTSAEMSRWLEAHKHLAEPTPGAASRN